jgi:hypothetical protein
LYLCTTYTAASVISVAVHKVDGVYARTSKDRTASMPVLQCGLNINVSSPVKIDWYSFGRHTDDENKHYEITKNDHPPTSILNFTRIGTKHEPILKLLLFIDYLDGNN